VSLSDAEFDRVVRSHATRVRHYALRLVRDPWLADDVLQETFLRAWKYWSTFRAESNREAWLIRICRNVAFDLLAKRNSRQESPLRDTADRNTTILSLDTSDALRDLSLEHREVIFLIDFLEYEYELAAEILEIPVGTVRSRLHRARSALRSSISDAARSSTAANNTAHSA
jgi:RNA polymerase sigma-70 factor (ECF subfamily)